MELSPRAFFHPSISVDGTAGDFDEGGWVRLERNMAADVAALWPGESIRAITGLHQWSNASNGQVMWMDDLQFSNSLTAEHNVIGSGAIGQIVRNRTVDTGTMAAMDRYSHYDQVGSVIATSNSGGTFDSQRFADAFGNTLNQWYRGLWEPTTEWSHNTKKFHADLGLTYMYQRWYLPETGTFTSRAPYTAWIEHPYGFALQNPVMQVDPRGQYVNNSGPGHPAPDGYEWKPMCEWTDQDQDMHNATGSWPLSLIPPPPPPDSDEDGLPDDEDEYPTVHRRVQDPNYDPYTEYKLELKDSALVYMGGGAIVGIIQGPAGVLPIVVIEIIIADEMMSTPGPRYSKSKK